jgi:hypothetical protein
MRRDRSVAGGRWGVAAAVGLMITAAAMPGLAQPPISNEASPGFMEISEQHEIVDLANRPWIGAGRSVGVRIDQTMATELSIYLPDPLLANANVQYSLDDPGYVNRFPTEGRAGKGVVGITVAAPLDPDRGVPYEMAFFIGNHRIDSPVREFTATENGIAGLPHRIKVRDWVYPTGREWLIVAAMFVAFMIAVTFGIYRPIYQWRLSRGVGAEQARDLAVFLWWMFALIGYAVLMYWRIPWSLPFLVFAGVLALVVLIRLAISLRPRGGGGDEATA